MYAVRPTDFRRDGDRWLACRSLGPGDLGALADFVPDSNPDYYRPAALNIDEEQAFASGRVSEGMESFLGRALGQP